MALIKFGGGVAGISGKIAGTVFARNKAGAYARNWAKPTSTPTPQQSANRTRFGAQSAAWSALPSSDKSAWEGLAAGITRINRFGEPYTPTGRQIFLESNNNLVANGTSGFDAGPPADYSPPALVIIPVLAAVTTAGVLTTLTVSGLDTFADLVYSIEGTPPQSDSKNNVSNLFRYLTTKPGTGSPEVILTPYTNNFGDAAVPGQIIWVRVRALSTVNGLYSPAYIALATITGT